MSIQAWLWAMYTGPRPAKPHQLPALLVLADKADETGRGAFPSVDTLAYCAGKDRRQIQKDLAALEDQGLIRRGDSARAAYIRRDRRPVVWDLALELRRSDPAPWEKDDTDNEQDSYPQAKPGVSAAQGSGVNHSSSRDPHGVNCGTSRGEPQTTRPPHNPPLKTSSSLSSSSSATVPTREEEGGFQYQDNPGAARIDYAAAAASLLGVTDAGWRRLGKRMRSDLALAVQRLIGEGAHPDALPDAVRAAGPIDGPDVKSPAAVLLYRLGDLDASALTEAPGKAVRPPEGKSGSSAAPFLSRCARGPECRDGQLVCDPNGCPAKCLGRHEPRGQQCPDCARTNTTATGPTFEQQLTDAIGTRPGLMGMDSRAA